MGILARVLSTVLDSVRNANFISGTHKSGGDVTSGSPQFNPPGIDSRPLEGDTALLIPGERTGTYVSNGYIDEKNASQIEPGEYRAYGRNSEGETVAELVLHGDGSADIFNMNGFIKLKDDGSVDINGVVIGADGSIMAPETISSEVDVLADGISGKSHTHPITSGSSAPGPTGAPT